MFMFRTKTLYSTHTKRSMFMFRTKTLYSTHTKRTVCSHFKQTLYSTHPNRSTFMFCTETPYFTHTTRSAFMFQTEILCTLRGQCSCFIQRHSGVEHFGDAGVGQETNLGDEGGDVVIGRDVIHQVEQPQGLVVLPVAQDGRSVAHHLQLIGISCKQEWMGGGGGIKYWLQGRTITGHLTDHCLDLYNLHLLPSPPPPRVLIFCSTR